MKYKCISKESDVTWLTIDKEYDGETYISSDPHYTGGQWLNIKKDDYGYPCLARKLHFVGILEKKNGDDLFV